MKDYRKIYFIYDPPPPGQSYEIVNYINHPLHIINIYYLINTI